MAPWVRRTFVDILPRYLFIQRPPKEEDEDENEEEEEEEEEEDEDEEDSKGKADDEEEIMELDFVEDETQNILEMGPDEEDNESDLRPPRIDLDVNDDDDSQVRCFKKGSGFFSNKVFKF